MGDIVKVELPVTRGAASLLRDTARAERVGRLVSEILSPTSPETDPLAPLIRELKAERQGIRTDRRGDRRRPGGLQFRASYLMRARVSVPC